MSEIRLTVEPRAEFGKGAARRTRRAGKIPAVLYGHNVEPQHLTLPSIEFARVIRENGQNAVLTLDVIGTTEKSTQLALTKAITIHPLKDYIEHVDLLVVRRGEKVTVDIPVVATGESGPGTLMTQDLDTIQIEVDALQIPEQIEVSIDDAEAGTQILAEQIPVPAGATLVTDPEALVIAVNEAPTEEAMEADVDTEGAGVIEEEPEPTETEEA